jgi:hypothetical protein
MLHPLDKVSLGYCAPDRTIPSLNTDCLIAFWISFYVVFMGCDWRYVGLGQVSTVEAKGRAFLMRSMRCAVHAWRGPGLGHIGQGYNIQGMLCSRGPTSKNFRSGTHRSGTHQPCMKFLVFFLRKLHLGTWLWCCWILYFIIIKLNCKLPTCRAFIDGVKQIIKIKLLWKALPLAYFLFCENMSQQDMTQYKICMCI